MRFAPSERTLVGQRPERPSRETDWRNAMVKAVYWGYRKPGLSMDELRRWMKEVHAPFVVNLPGIRGYVQHVALEDGSPEPRGFDLMVTTLFDDLPALQAALASPEFHAAAADAPDGVDMERLQMVVVAENYAWP
jgi:uncharacterized protein (TIGR02118 family)